jgi:hypothetical protein
MKLFGGQKFKDVIKKSFLLTSATFFLSYPYLYHYMVHKPDYLSPFNAKNAALSSEGALLFQLGQILAFLFLIFISSFTGFGFSEKYGLGGFGNLTNLKRDLRFLPIAAIPIGIAIFFAFDKFLIDKIPTLYPNDPKWGFAKALITSSTFEVVSKFGLLTVAMGIFRNKHIAVFLSAVFFAILVPRTFAEYGVIIGWDYLSIFAIASTFIYGILSGYLFIWRGLMTVIAFRFLLDLKYFVYPLLIQ